MPASLPRFEEMLATLVNECSVSCTSPDIDRSNLKVIEHLANWLEGLGFTTELTPLPDQPDKANLIATLPASAAHADPSKRGLVLAGHTDTVPFDEALWQSDPLSLTERDNRFYGLGACDMKGFFPVAMAAAAKFVDANLSAPLTIVATSDEESSMAGARLLMESGRPLGDYAIIGEPTDLRPIYAHKGIMMLAIRLQGSSGHSSNPDLGRNALDAMHDVMSHLIAFRKDLAARYQNPGFEVDIPTMNLGCLRAGDNPNRICGHAELQIDLRLLPGMDTNQVVADLTSLLTRAGEAHGTAVSVELFYPPVPPFQTPVDADLVQMLARGSGNTPGTVAFGTEGPFLQSLGMETVIFGPGSIDQAHQPNEFMAHDQIEPATRVLSDAIRRYCLN